jgi:hypothetical protein
VLLLLHADHFNSRSLSGVFIHIACRYIIFFTVVSMVMQRLVILLDEEKRIADKRIDEEYDVVLGAIIVPIFKKLQNNLKIIFLYNDLWKVKLIWHLIETNDRIYLVHRTRNVRTIELPHSFTSQRIIIDISFIEWIFIETVTFIINFMIIISILKSINFIFLNRGNPKRFEQLCLPYSRNHSDRSTSFHQHSYCYRRTHYQSLIWLISR